jgi:hypothetical protein
VRLRQVASSVCGCAKHVYLLRYNNAPHL